MLTVREGFYDEMLDEGGAPRAHARTLVDALAALGPDADGSGPRPPVPARFGQRGPWRLRIDIRDVKAPRAGAWRPMTS